MKLTISFDSVRVIVPCGNGDLSVGELIDRAVSRYRKATNKVCISYNRSLFLKK